jgi:hypothetical protein
MNYGNATIPTLETQLRLLGGRLSKAHHVLDASPPGILRQRLRQRLLSLQDEAIIVRYWIRIKTRQKEHLFV